MLRGIGLLRGRDLPLVREAVEDTETKRSVPEYLASDKSIPGQLIWRGTALIAQIP